MISLTMQQGKQYRQVFSQNDEMDFEVTLRDQDGNPIDLTGLTVTMPAKLSLFDDSAAFTISGTLVTAAAGIVKFPVTDTHTGEVRDYYAEIRATNSTTYTETLILFQFDVRKAVS